MTTNKFTGISVFALVMLISGAVDSIRNLPATALFGTSLIFFFAFSAMIFLIPAALVSAELASTCNKNSGIFHWTRGAFGDKIAFLAVWLLWITNLVWFPTILSFIVGTAAYFISPALAQNKTYLVSAILVVFWFLTIINMRGLKLSAKFTSFCAVAGLVIPMALIITLASIWLLSGHPSQIHFSVATLIPTFNNPQNWISLTAIMTAFLGIELAAVHIKDIANPQRNFPKALYFSVVLILATMILGALAIAVVLPKDQINLVNGMMQAFANFFAMYHISWIMPIITTLIVIGTAGGVISWIISPARGLLQAAQVGFLPEFFRKENKHGVASNLLITQAVLVSLFCTAFLLMPSVNGSYWFLTALSTQMYMIMYIIMFAVGIVLRYKNPNQERGFTIPGGKFGLWFTCLTGICGCVITIVVGFIPPGGIEVGNIMRYETIFVSGMIAMTIPAFLCWAYQSRDRRSSSFPLSGLATEAE